VTIFPEGVILARVCPACGDQPVRPPHAVCTVDRDDVRRSLAGLAEAYEAMIEPAGGAKGRAGKGSPRAEPLAEHLSRVRTAILTTLAPWVREHRAASWRDGAPRDVLFAAVQFEAEAGDRITAMVVYLRAAEDWLLADDQRAVAYVHAVQRIADRVDRVRAPRGRSGVPIGWHGAGNSDGCPAGIDAGDGPRSLVWAEQVNGDGECAGCGLVRTVAAWHAEWPELDDDLLTDAEAVAWLAVTYGVAVTRRNLRDWRSRGHVPAADERRLGLIATKRGTLKAYAARRWTSDVAV
jgi:hypothetical protein